MGSNEMENCFEKYERAVDMEPGQLIAYSAHTGVGKKFLWKMINQALFGKSVVCYWLRRSWRVS